MTIVNVTYLLSVHLMTFELIRMAHFIYAYCVSRSNEHMFTPPPAAGVPAAAVDYSWSKLVVGCFILYLLLELLKIVVALLKS